jgi:hypothetical protein
MLYDLKSKLSKQKNLFLKSATNQRENVTASYKVCLELVKRKNPFRDGELIKCSAIKMVNYFSDSKNH